MPEPYGAQAERTSLAWQRTGLAQLGAAAVMLRMAGNGDLVTAILAGMALLILAGGTLVEATLRHPRRLRWLNYGAHPGLSLAALATVAGIPLLAACGLALLFGA